LGEYITVLRQAPTNPLLHLMIGLCYIHIACQKFTPKRDWVVLQGLAFLNSYLSLRGECQESLYNLGRAFQQLGEGHLFFHSHSSIHFYKKRGLPLHLEVFGVKVKGNFISFAVKQTQSNLSNKHSQICPNGCLPLAVMCVMRPLCFVPLRHIPY
jgi:hypothetical protein